MKRSRIRIQCLPLLGDHLKTEVESMDYKVLNHNATGVEIEGDFEDCIRLNLFLRTATRVLYQLKRFTAKDSKALYDEVFSYSWPRLLRANGYLHVDSFVKHAEVRDTSYPNRVVKDAVVDSLQKYYGRRPDSGPSRHGTVLYLFWTEKEGMIYLDTSGEVIAKHGYRKNPHKAPMMESLAASTILASVWDKKQPFVNPMCGSGTLAIEAALMAKNQPPGLHRDNFGFMHCKWFRRARFEELTDLARRQAGSKGPMPTIIATDRDQRAIRAAEANAAEAGVRDMITFEVCDFRETQLPEEEGVIFMNPEYGERLGEAERLQPTYKAIGDFFKQEAAGYTGYVFTGNMDLAKKIGLRTSRKIPFMNGRIECRLLEYEMYHGSRR
ncbi:class I SAM-dependent RNA methyltransferase [Roseivirga sp. BDSF3-8]|uniref:THUMP domain-containing class I SAM-dependent RNA methyltransferase n=1 Tax=Roseivirga sp. BDSF3-8 TaxID=3241598 RepID=UPI003531FDAF